MFVKICGITTREDALAAIGSGAQALGFNFVPSSPRFLNGHVAGEWIADLPLGIWKVGVFADCPAKEVAAICERWKLDVAQLHGSEEPDQIPKGMRVWKAARVQNGFVPQNLFDFPSEAVLLDGPASGVPFDWSKANPSGRKLILAGGLSPLNVREAVERVRPWGVDVCSRVEISPGRKDHRLMAQFIHSALSC